MSSEEYAYTLHKEFVAKFGANTTEAKLYDDFRLLFLGLPRLVAEILDVAKRELWEAVMEDEKLNDVASPTTKASLKKWFGEQK